MVIRAALFLLCLAIASPAFAFAKGWPSIRPKILTRESWGAAPAREELLKTHTLSGIVVHHTDTQQNFNKSLESKLRSLQSFSQRPGVLDGSKKRKPAWGDVPYHYYIDVEGRIGEGRALKFKGDSNTGYDTTGFIQIAVEGRFEKEKPTAEQLSALQNLVAWLVWSHGISPEKISSHNDHASTDCPGKNLKPFVEDLRRRLQHQ